MRSKKTRQTLWDIKHWGDFSQDGREGFQGWGTRKEWQNKFKDGGGKKTEVKRLFKEYLLGSLSPFQPHHCFLSAFVSLTDSPAHLETWRRFESYNTGGTRTEAGVWSSSVNHRQEISRLAIKRAVLSSRWSAECEGRETRGCLFVLIFGNDSSGATLCTFGACSLFSTLNLICASR